MAPGLSTDGSRRLLGAPATRVVVLTASVGLLLLVGLSRPNAAQPDLSPSGWAPGPLLPLTLSPAAVTAVLWAGYALGAAGVWLGLRQRPAGLRSWAVPGTLAVLALLVAPFGSADHINYLAYGRILDQGGDPWLASPAGWAGGTDPVTSRVEAPWTEEPSVYGPAGTLLHGLAALVGGDNLREGVWAWQVVVVLAWLGVRALLRATLPPEARGRVDVLWTTNPVLLGVAVLGAHIDVVATALALAAVAVAARRPGVTGALAAGAVAGLALSTKVTYGIVLVGLAGAWWLAARRGEGRAGRVPWGRVGALTAGALATAATLHAWAGPHVFDQLARSRQAVSLATPWRPLLDGLGPAVGNGPTRTLIGVGAAVLALLLAGLLLRLSAPARPAASAAGSVRLTGTTAADALRLTGCLALAYALAAPYSLPWYDVLVWAALPALLPGALDLVALGRLLVMAWAYVPGRVLGMTPTVESVTLGFRRDVAPWLSLALWAAVTAVAVRRGSRPSTGRRRAAGPRPPTR